MNDFILYNLTVSRRASLLIYCCSFLLWLLVNWSNDLTDHHTAACVCVCICSGHIIVFFFFFIS